MVPFTQKMLLDWAGPTVFRDAQTLFERGAVHVVSFEPPFIKGTISVGSRSIDSKSRVMADGTVENLCPCRDNVERGIICSHVIALGLALIRRAADPELAEKQREEARKAARMARLGDTAYIKRTPSEAHGAVPAKLRLQLARGWQDACPTGPVPVNCFLEYASARHPLGEVPHDATFRLSKQDESLLFVLEDISEGPAKSALKLAPADFVNVLSLHGGKSLSEEGRQGALTVNPARMSSIMKVDLDHETGEVLLVLHTELPFLQAPDRPVYIVAAKEGWVYGAGHFWPLAHVLPGPLRAIYKKPAVIPRDGVPRFFQTELPVLAKHVTIQTDLSIDLFTVEPSEPRFRLQVRGSPASLAATLYAEYNGIVLVAGKPDPSGHFALPDPEDLLRYTVRNPRREEAALERLARTGVRGEAGDALSAVVGTREVMNFLGRDLPALRRLGWRIEMVGKVHEWMEEADFVTPVVRVAEQQGGDWFDVDFDYDARGGSISAADVQRALLKGEAFIEKGGRTILLDAEAIRSMNDVFSDCAASDGGKPGSFRLAGIYASYVKSSLDALDGVDVEATSAWQDRARKQNRELALEPLALPDRLEGILRGYQKEGVQWLRFLEASDFGGILADEMGLGKTLQTLAWLQLQRLREGAQHKPALIICPTSLVENWAEESARFTPSLRVLTVSGSARHEKWAAIGEADLVVTSYALLRRDIEQYVGTEFAAAILDEAQHIKNRSTQNAIAAKRVKATHRLVLTGTPIENSVSDLWSIMDYLMPGYLGAHESFRQRYELPIGKNGDEGDAAQARLKRKMQPFLLRRLKREVAQDLPPKIERMATCTLSTDQQIVYRQYLEASQRRIADMVEQQGFNRSRMEILKTLLRLRQVCCHLDLLKLPDLKPASPSAKLDLFFELLDEALDGGHRVLVFSQFTTMLGILRAELDRRQIAYCYLDGSTQDRLKVVHEFNTNRKIPIFLISLKAGGTGLNLTGADMVIHYDPWWNPAVEDQATDRAYRIGQKKTVYSVKLITKGTVEEKVLALQKKKQAVIDATLETDEQVIGAMTWEDIRELLSL
jgi:superfamily II DNA or RNA helicase